MLVAVAVAVAFGAIVVGIWPVLRAVASWFVVWIVVVKHRRAPET
jgi:hypothetical protein